MDAGKAGKTSEASRLKVVGKTRGLRVIHLQYLLYSFFKIYIELKIPNRSFISKYKVFKATKDLSLEELKFNGRYNPET